MCQPLYLVNISTYAALLLFGKKRPKTSTLELCGKANCVL